MQKVINFISMALVFVLVICAIVKCSENNPKPEQKNKFNKGDVVYLKPDSLKVVIYSTCACGEYSVYYFDDQKRKIGMKVEESLIF